MEAGGTVMRAVVVHSLGGPEQLALEEVAEPVPGAGELLVEVEAAGLNFIDTYHRTGLYPMDLPFVPGVEGAGRVLDAGSEAEGFATGDLVAWCNVMGSYAERLVVPAARAVPVPDGITARIAAAVILQGITAHYLATDTFPLHPGHRCLIHAGAGGVGLLLTQIAKKRGAEVITTVGTEEKASLSREAGADRVVVYGSSDFKGAIEEAYGPHPLDVVFDGVGAATFLSSIELLKPRGMMVTFGNASGPVPEISPLLLSQKGSLFLTRPTMAHYMATRDELLGRCEDLFSWIGDGWLRVRIGEDYELAEAAEAHRALQARRTTGKVLLIP
jgi:NADPH2:quinone reductase